MGMLDRYKKKGGFVQLLTLIETSGKQKQDQFLNLIAQENATWEQAIRGKMLSLDRILSWDATVLAEIFSRTQPLTLAVILHGLEADKLNKALSCLSNSDQRKIQNEISERSPTPAEKTTCVMRMITEVRGYCMGGVIKLDKVDPELAIPENYEDKLTNQSLSISLETNHEPMDPNVPPTDGSKLDFHDKPESNNSSNREEVEFLKKRVNQLVAENNMIKHELSVVRGKLDQIKKIA